MTTAQVLSWLVASAIGFCGGYLAGRVGRDVSEHHGVVESRWWASIKVLFGLLLLAVVAWSTYTLVRQSTCQAEFNEDFVRGLDERSAATDAEREANKIRWGFIRDVIRNPLVNPTEEQRREMGLRWVRELDRADQLVIEAEAKRAANPFPTTRRCDR